MNRFKTKSIVKPRLKIDCGTFGRLLIKTTSLFNMLTFKRHDIKEACWLTLRTNCRPVLKREWHLLPEHVHVLISITSNQAVSPVIGYMKGKLWQPPGADLHAGCVGRAGEKAAITGIGHSHRG